MNLRRVVFFFAFVCLVVDNPQERPFSGMWESPLAPIGSLIYDNLHKVTGIELLRFSGLDLALGILLLCSAMRRPGGGVPVAKGMTLALTGAFFALVWLEMWGVVRGGDFKSSLWQFRQLIWLPGVVYIFGRVVRDERDFKTMGRIVVASAVIKVGLGMYFKIAIIPTLEREPNFVTSHSDSLLFVTSLFIVVANYLQTRSRKAILLGAWVVPIIMVGLVINNRRLAFVSFGAGLCVMYALLRGPTKRMLQKTAIVMSPFVLMYIIAGRNHGDTPIFKPAASIASVFLQKDRSSATRDIENYNLIQTLKRNKVMGSGFGHEYVELVKADSISQHFAMYRYIGHNSVLWLLSVAGLLGFIGVWMFLAVGVYFSTRAFKFARTAPERAAAEVSAAVIMAYVIQAWGDMGLQSWVGIFVLAGALTIAGKLAVSTGAWRQGAL